MRDVGAAVVGEGAVGAGLAAGVVGVAPGVVGGAVVTGTAVVADAGVVADASSAADEPPQPAVARPTMSATPTTPNPARGPRRMVPFVVMVDECTDGRARSGGTAVVEVSSRRPEKARRRISTCWRGQEVLQ